MHIEFFEGDRATQYDDSIPTWVPNYKFIQQSIPSILTTYLSAEIDPKILVVGCGTGQEISEIKKRKPLWKVLGIDPSPQMIKLAQMKLAYREKDPKLDLKTGIVSDLPLQAKYDAATLILVLHFIPNTDDGKLALLKNIAERLQPGAPLVISDIYQSETFEEQKALFKHYMIAKGISSEMVEEGLQHVMKDTHRLSSVQFNELLQEAGFGKPQMFSKAYYYGGWVAVKR